MNFTHIAQYTKKTHVIVGMLILVIIGFALSKEITSMQSVVTTSPLDTMYEIEGEKFHLVGGIAEKEIAPDSVIKNRVSVFGEPSYGDIDDDGDKDAILLLLNEPGGSGAFFYAVLAINAGGIYRGTDGILLGDRVAPQTFYIKDGKAIVNYADRAVGESFTTPASIGKSLYLTYDHDTYRLITIEPNFEGEADAGTMTLQMKTWNWVRTVMNNDNVTMPKKSGVFKITFMDNKTFSASTDCNGVGGEYVQNGNQIKLEKMMSTLMYCEGSQEQEFSKALGEVESFSFTGKGELILNLKFDSGSMVFN